MACHQLKRTLMPAAGNIPVVPQLSTSMSSYLLYSNSDGEGAIDDDDDSGDE